MIAEAKPAYSESDRVKLESLLGYYRERLDAALRKFANERGFPELLPIERLHKRPVLVFPASCTAPPCSAGFSYLRVSTMTKGNFEGALTEHVCDDGH